MLNRIWKMPGTMLLIIAWIVICCLAKAKDVAPTLSGKGISHMGKEYYRFFTAGLTHTNLIHLIVNVCAMFWIGWLYEQQLGSIKFISVGIICAVATQIIFLCIYRNTTDSVGGSAYCFALCGFGLAMQWMVPEFPRLQFGTWSGSWLIIYLILSNVPVFSFINVTTIIFHLVAFVFGILAAALCRLLRI